MWYRDTNWENTVGKIKNGTNRFAGYKDAKKPSICGVGGELAKHNKTRYACS